MKSRIEAANFPQDQLEVIAVDNDRDSYKQSPTAEEKGLNIHRVPTFIFYKDGNEVNRIVESPVETFERDILAISFDSGDTLENIETYTLADGRIIDIARRETKLPVKSQSFLAQILGNIGNINPGDFF